MRIDDINIQGSSIENLSGAPVVIPNVQIITASGVPTDTDLFNLSGVIISKINVSSGAPVALVQQASGDIISEINADFYDKNETNIVSGDIINEINDNFYDKSEINIISGDIVQAVPSSSYQNTFLIGDWTLSGSAYNLDFNHNLNRNDIIVQIYEESEIVYVSTKKLNNNNVRLTIPSSPDVRFSGEIIIS